MFIFAAEIKSNKNMEELKVLANSYAEENVINVLKESFAKVYADGYRDGYKAREEQFPVNLCDNETEFVDLGLPSGTKWSSDYMKDGNNKEYLPYGRAESLSIPTKEQWEELCDICKWEYSINNAYNLFEARCVGPNGNALKFDWTGKRDIDTLSAFYEVFFWINDDIDGNDKYAAHIYNAGKVQNLRIGAKNTEECFSGFKLPIRLVRKK